MNVSNPQQHDLAETRPAASSAVTVEELQYHLEGLRSLFVFALVGLIAGTLAVDLFFIRPQMVSVRTQVDDQRPKVSKLIADYKKMSEPQVRNFVASLQSFAASNHDFQPILDKYRLVFAPYMAPSSPAGPASTAVKPPQK